eukprot:1120254-Prymnesium_polylepis.1
MHQREREDCCVRSACHAVECGVASHACCRSQMRVRAKVVLSTQRAPSCSQRLRPRSARVLADLARAASLTARIELKTIIASARAFVRQSFTPGARCFAPGRFTELPSA